jgi:glycerol-3-phosphate dehydrogenase (NAD(P)+)
MKMVAEGVETCDAAVALAQSHNVDLPIIQQMHAVLHGRSTPRAALRELMDRSLKSE